jgi:hypothetical protein
MTHFIARTYNIAVRRCEDRAHAASNAGDVYFYWLKCIRRVRNVCDQKEICALHNNMVRVFGVALM